MKGGKGKGKGKEGGGRGEDRLDIKSFGSWTSASSSEIGPNSKGVLNAGI